MGYVMTNSPRATIVQEKKKADELFVSVPV